MKHLISILPLMALAGCAGWSGYDSKSTFSCKAPEGVLCESMSGIYANAMQNNLPAQRMGARGDSQQAGDAELSHAKEGQAVMTKPLYSGSPIRTAPKILRVWFAPWEDADGDLHDQSYVYLPVDTGRWQVEHNRRRILDAYRPVRPPAKTHANAAAQQALKNAGKAQLPQQQESGDVEEIGVNQGVNSFGDTAKDIMKGIFTPSDSSRRE